MSDYAGARSATLLIVGIDPASEWGCYCENWKTHERPEGYEAVKQGIISGLRKGVISGKHFGLPDTDINGNEIGELSGTTDVERSLIERDSLVTWLGERGVKTGFFFPNNIDNRDYLDPKNSRYAPKLAAAVLAWEAVIDPNGRHPKQALMKWLREHGAKFGLTNDDGAPNETGIEEVAKVANWQPGGGAARTPTTNLTPP